jgi:hypothetical protein
MLNLVVGKPFDCYSKTLKYPSIDSPAFILDFLPIGSSKCLAIVPKVFPEFFSKPLPSL